MGEYYNWVNVDRREYICPSDFDLGNKLWETSAPHNAFLCALRELLGNEWCGSHIVFLGDSQKLSRDDDNRTIKTLYDHTVDSGYEGLGFDTVFETYKNISGLFSGSEKNVRKEIEFFIREVEIGETGAFNEYDIDLNDPYKGLFARNGRDYRYTLNHTKRLYYSLEDVVITGCDKKDVDPLPYLLRHGYDGTGEWVGDIAGVSDDVPEGYSLIREIIID